MFIPKYLINFIKMLILKTENISGLGSRISSMSFFLQTELDESSQLLIHSSMARLIPDVKANFT